MITLLISGPIPPLSLITDTPGETNSKYTSYYSFVRVCIVFINQWYSWTRFWQSKKSLCHVDSRYIAVEYNNKESKKRKARKLKLCPTENSPKHPIPRPYGRAMGCLICVLWRKYAARYREWSGLINPSGAETRIFMENMPITYHLEYIDGILPKGPYPSCLRMAYRALLAGYPRYVDTMFQPKSIKLVWGFPLHLKSWPW